MDLSEEEEIQMMEVVESDAPDGELMFLALNLAENMDALTKSQLPDMKKKKALAVDRLIILYEQNFGRVLTSKILLKKLNNMKTRLKRKTDQNSVKQTGNRPLVKQEKLCQN
uniref:Uncharacterized protein n=1 Tax=Cacopsylla melanoneura TaxID=428564 RepID=A0A8D9AMD1_9HEMI